MKKILIIDDSKSVHAFVKHCFRGTEVELTSAFNGQEGLQFLAAAQKNEYDLILLDWEMPVMDGPTTLPQIMKSNKSATVLMMTSRSSEEDITRMMDLGATEYIMKPFTKDILVNKTYSFLGLSYENVS